jgi:hypothetical protein
LTTLVPGSAPHQFTPARFDIWPAAESDKMPTINVDKYALFEELGEQ